MHTRARNTKTTNGHRNYCDQISDTNKTQFHREAITNNHVEIWTKLLENPAINPNLADDNGRTALHVANWFNKVNTSPNITCGYFLFV